MIRVTKPANISHGILQRIRTLTSGATMERRPNWKRMSGRVAMMAERVVSRGSLVA